MTSSLAVFEAEIQVKSKHVTKSGLKPEKRRNMEINNIFT